MSRNKSSTKQIFTSGFTLVETVISLGMFMLVTLSIINLTAFTSNAVERITVRSELLENARIAVDVMSLYIKAAEEIYITTDDDLSGLQLMEITLSSLETRKFSYSSRYSPNDAKYHRLSFGGNELASYIAHVRVALDGDILTLSVLTDDSISTNGALAEPVSLTVKIKVYCDVSIV